MSEIRSQATPAREELLENLRDAELPNTYYHQDDGCGTPAIRPATSSEAAEMALDVVEAAGWSKPRTVNSATELDALKPGTVLRFPDGEIGMIMVTHDKRHVIGYPGILPTAELADASQHCFGDGITVLFTPGDAG